MRSFRIFNRRAGAVLAAASLVLGATLPAALASAETVTDRSIALTSSVKNTDSMYRVKFTAGANGATDTGAFVIDFCTTATIGAACTPPSGLSTSSVDVDTSTADAATASSINSDGGVKVVLTTPASAGGDVDVTLKGIHNPTASGVFYARIVTYEDGTAPAGGHYYYVAPDNLDNTGANPHLDDGSVALTATDGFTVGGRALETLTFCASGATISQADCSGTTSPNLTLGSGGILSTTASTGDVYTQISTNAVGGAVVNLKSGASGCGGLLRDGTGTAADRCGITPLTAGVASIADNSAKFGMKLGSLSATTGQVDAVGNYGTTNFYMGYNGTDESDGVTSPYGDPIYNTHAGPINLGKATLTFGANISNVTPAGNYSATLNLIATGTF